MWANVAIASTLAEGGTVHKTWFGISKHAGTSGRPGNGAERSREAVDGFHSFWVSFHLVLIA